MCNNMQHHVAQCMNCTIPDIRKQGKGEFYIFLREGIVSRLCTVSLLGQWVIQLRIPLENEEEQRILRDLEGEGCCLVRGSIILEFTADIGETKDLQKGYWTSSSHFGTNKML